MPNTEPAAIELANTGLNLVALSAMARILGLP
jgi:hypothetical protein